jgi:hypothetical protein
MSCIVNTSLTRQAVLTTMGREVRPMWKQVRTLLDFDTFRRGCECYYALLVAMGLALQVPAEDGMFASGQSEASSSPAAATDAYAMKALRNIPHIVASAPTTHNLYYWN